MIMANETRSRLSWMNSFTNMAHVLRQKPSPGRRWAVWGGSRCVIGNCSWRLSHFLAGDRNLLALKARLVLAGQAVTHRNVRWLALDRQVQLAAAARRASAGHEL